MGHWWERLLHNQTGLLIKARLEFFPGVMVTAVPYQLASSQHALERAVLTLAKEHAGLLRADPPWRTPRFDDVEWSVQDRTVTLTGPLDAPWIRELTAWATQNDTLPEALSVQPRSLEDVFLEVSGGNAP